jgi:hypothetical protein
MPTSSNTPNSQDRNPRHLHARNVKDQLRSTVDVTAVGKTECNPNGQWLWLEHEAGLPIAAALADLLSSGVSPW